MQEKDFEQLSAKTLDGFADILDELDAKGALELEYEKGIITITLHSGKQFIVNKHAPSRQIWLSSPLSGGLHFPYDEVSGEWKLADGREIGKLLAAELKTLSGIDIVL